MNNVMEIADFAPETQELMIKKVYQLERKFREVKILNKNRFNVRRNSGEWEKVVLKDNMALEMNGQLVCNLI